jgi:hypothetical protein
MLEDTIRQMRSRIRSNPLAPLLDQYIGYLVARGNSAATLRDCVRVAEHFGQWLRKRPLCEAAVSQFKPRLQPRALIGTGGSGQGLPESCRRAVADLGHEACQDSNAGQ